MRCSTDNREPPRVAKARLRRALHVACGARLGWAVFTEYRTYDIAAAGEVCANYAECGDFDRIDGTMRWAGGSRSARGLMSALRISARIPEQPAIVFFTDGHRGAAACAANFVPIGRTTRPTFFWLLLFFFPFFSPFFFRCWC